MRRICLLFLIVSGASLNALPQRGQTSALLGSGRGVDHVGIALRDLKAARLSYQETLGFNVSPGGKHPGGTQNAIPQFEDGTYLELITFYDRQKADWLAKFLERHEGAVFLGLDVSSAAQAATLLRGRGFAATGPQGGTIMTEGITEPPPDMWWIVEFNSGIKARDYSGGIGPMFLIEYDKNQSEKWHREASDTGRLKHPNTAMGIRSVWIAVDDAGKESKSLDSAGFRLAKGKRINGIGGDGPQADAGRGVIRVLQPSDPKGKVATFLADRGEGIMGITIEVSSLQKARGIIEQATKQKFAPYQGVYGNSILVPPNLTHGVWLELFQK